MEASVNVNTATVPTVTPSVPRVAPPPAAAIVPTVPPAVPAPRRAAQPRNWGMIFRVGLVLALVLSLIGYALKVTYESVIQGGVVNAGDHFKVELKQMSNFEMDQAVGTVADVPERFRELDGKRVVLDGEVAPGGTFSGETVKQFSLCYSVAKCCFGGPPKVQHFVLCQDPRGRMMRNFEGQGPVRVFGTLHVKVVKGDSGRIDSVFQMDVERIERES